jgi:hypothetical protein
VTDPVDTDLANRMRATMHLIGEARAWERVASDESLLAGVREFARQRAQAIREELSPC